MMIYILSILSAYLIGSFPTSFILAKIVKGVDIRLHGSGNIGATNVLRVIGKVPAAIALAVDIIKGILVVTILADFFYPYIKNLDYEPYRVLLGFLAICGHIWPVFLRFKGGKGIATTIGVLIVIAPKVLALSIGVWLLIFLATNYVSLASMALTLSAVIFTVSFRHSLYLIIFTVTICIITTYKHKDNIKRLINGEEKKVILFK